MSEACPIGSTITDTQDRERGLTLHTGRCRSPAVADGETEVPLAVYIMGIHALRFKHTQQIQRGYFHGRLNPFELTVKVNCHCQMQGSGFNSQYKDPRDGSAGGGACCRA